MGRNTFLVSYIGVALLGPLAIFVLSGVLFRGQLDAALSFGLWALSVPYLILAGIAYARGVSTGRIWLMGFPVFALVFAVLPLALRMMVWGQADQYQTPGDAMRDAGPVVRGLIWTGKLHLPFILHVACCVIGAREAGKSAGK